MDDKIKTILKANHLYDKDNKKLENFNITHNKLDEFYDTYKQNHTNKQSIPEVKRDKEGRIITLEFENFYLVTNYTPNAKRELERLDYRMVWEDEIRKYLLELNKKKPVIMCGDLNVAHEEIDLKNPKTNRGNAGLTNEEREKMTELLNAGFIDSYRYLYPEKIEYSWWSYMGHAREKNVGWRIDYFIVSNDFRENIKDATIYTEILGSDHCPVGLEIK